LSGNVWEWCLNPYRQSVETGGSSNESRVLRGGAWNNNPHFCRAAGRLSLSPDARYDGVGFRVCRGSPIETRDAATLDAETPSR